MNKPEKANEPSMDEILSSIRRIIAEEPIGPHGSQAAPTAKQTADLHTLTRDPIQDQVSVSHQDALAQERPEPHIASEFAPPPSEPLSTAAPASPDAASDFSVRPAAVAGLTPGHAGSSSQNQRLEPQLPMPEDRSQQRSPLSSRLATALRGDAPGPASEPTPSAFDDDALSEALGEINENVEGSDNGNASYAPEHVAPDLGQTSVEVQPTTADAPLSDEPVSTFRAAQDELLNTKFEPLGHDTLDTAQHVSMENETPSGDAFNGETAGSSPDDVNALTDRTSADDRTPAPFFGNGPTPPAHLRPTPFTGSQLASKAEEQQGVPNDAIEQEVPGAANAVDENAAIDLSAESSAVSGEEVQTETTEDRVPVASAEGSDNLSEQAETRAQGSVVDGPVVIASTDPTFESPSEQAPINETALDAAMEAEDVSSLQTNANSDVEKDESVFSEGTLSKEDDVTDDDVNGSVLARMEQDRSDANVIADQESKLAAEQKDSLVVHSVDDVVPEEQAEVTADTNSAIIDAAIATTSGDGEEGHARAETESDEAANLVAASSSTAPELTKETTVTTTLTANGVQTLEDTVAELLRPLLREWLANNMPRIVEKALRIEIAQSNTETPGPEKID